MLPKYHIVFGMIISLIIYFLFQITFFQFLLIFLSSFLIDVDHYFYYIFKEKNLSLTKAYAWGKKSGRKWDILSLKEKKEYKTPIFIFHGIEFLFLLVILSFFNNLFLYIFLGIIIHLILDFIDIIHTKDLLLYKFSQIYVYIRNKNKKIFNKNP